MKLSIDKLLELFPDGRLDSHKKNILCKCPSCGKDEFGVSVEDNHRMGCYRGKCGYRKNIFSYLKEIGRLQEFTDPDQIYSSSTGLLVKREFISREQVNLEIPTISKPIGWKRVFSDPYLDSRGFTEHDYQKYKIGRSTLDSKRDKHVTFLIEQDQEIKGYISRLALDLTKDQIKEHNKSVELTGKGEKLYRYRNSDNTEFTKLLLGSEEITENTTTIIVVEGLLDKVNVDRVLLLDQQEEIKCVCTWKCDVSNEQVFKLQQFSSVVEVILFYDPDVINTIKKVALELEYKFPSVKVALTKTTKDPGEMNLLDILEVWDGLQNVDSFVTSKLQRRSLD